MVKSRWAWGRRMLRSLRCVGAFSDPPPQPAPKTQPTTEPIHLDTFLARYKGPPSKICCRYHYRTNHARYTSKWEWRGEHSIAHAAAAVVGVCVHVDNMLACKLRLIAFSEKTKMTMVRGRCCQIQACELRNVKPNTTARNIVSKSLEICLGLTM